MILNTTRRACFTSTFVPALLLFGLAFSGQVLNADVVLFEDSANSLSAITNGSTRISANCSFGQCGVIISAPSGMTFWSSDLYDLGAGVMLGKGENIAFPGGQYVSTTIALEDSLPVESLVFGAVSYTPGSPLLLCADTFPFPGCPFVENGAIQTVGSVTWEDGNGHRVTDFVEFQSDVPEPSYTLLSATLFIGIGILINRRAAWLLLTSRSASSD